MHPIFILVPVSALVLGPRIWVNHVLRQHNFKDEDLPGNAAELAREWLDRNRLQGVPVEITDLGDHYDPEAAAVRLSRDKYTRRTLTAVTTAAHEVSHAIQDATAYAPFVWRTRLTRLAQVTGQMGSVVLLTVPATALLTGRPIPPLLVGGTLFAMLGSGLAAQLVALPSELDASFKRAMPLLQNGVIPDDKVSEARKILIACYLTYFSSSLLSVLNFWPWLGRGGALLMPLVRPATVQITIVHKQRAMRQSRNHRPVHARRQTAAGRRRLDTQNQMLRAIAKPLIRGFFQVSALVRKRI